MDTGRVRETTSPDTIWPSMTSRPLSDIREITEPSLIAAATTATRHTKASQARSRRPPLSLRAHAPFAQPTPEASSSPEQATTPEASSCYTIPHSSIPQRSSSQTHSRRPSERHALQVPALRRADSRQHIQSASIPSRGQSISPVKEAQLRLDPALPREVRRISSRTFVRRPHPVDILDHPTHKHSRVKLELKLSAPLSVGGGTIEGGVKCVVDDNVGRRDRRPLSMRSLSIDVLGFESVETDRRAIFLSLGVELVHANNPPPPGMREPTTYQRQHESLVPLCPSSTFLPFAVNLPLDTGPPPFQSKHVSVRFVVSATAIIQDAGKIYRVRVTEDIHVLPTYDPETALASLARPLTTFEDLCISGTRGSERIQLTAGIHRQVWISGGSVFADVHIVNRSQKHVSKLELSLEQTILCYRHPKTTTGAGCETQPRLFDRKYDSQLNTTTLRANASGWDGVRPHSSETRTCEVEVPRNLASMTGGKYFEVHYFLNITAVTNAHKRVSVQLPVTLIHLNSLDVMPNAIGQVAAAMAEERLHRPQRRDSTASTDIPSRHTRPYTPGCAFAAPREKSLNRQRAQEKDMKTLRHMIDNSPRKNAPTRSKPQQRNVSTPWTVYHAASSDTLTSIDEKEVLAEDIAFPVNRTNSPLPWLSSKPSGRKLHERLRIRPSLDSIHSRLKGKSPMNVKGSIGGPRIVLAHTLNPQALGLRETAKPPLSSSTPVPPRKPSMLSMKHKENQCVEAQPVRAQHRDVLDAAGWI